MFDLEDDERRRLARELHNLIAQNVAALIMDLDLILHRQGIPSELRADLFQCVSLARQNLHEIVMFCYHVHPLIIDDLGLPAALRVYREVFTRSNGMRVDLEVPDSYTKLSNELEITLFRVVCEGLTRARRQFNSSWAKVRMDVNAIEARVTVENDLGIDSSLRQAAKYSGEMGIGITSIQERIQQLGGRISFRSNQHGSVLEAVLPLSRAANAIGV